MEFTPIALAGLSPFAITMIVIAVVLIAALVFLYFFGKKQQKKMDENQKEIDAAAQQITMLVIDKKKMRLTKAGLPQMVIDATPKYARMAKVPVVKAKVGPRVMTLIADANIFDMIPVKQEIKATVSGIYITKVRALRGPALVRPGKKTFRQKLMDKVKSTQAEQKEQPKKSGKSTTKKK